MKQAHFFGLALSLCLIFFSDRGFGTEQQSETDKQFTIVKTLAFAKIDGQLNERLWLEAAVVSDFHQIYPNEYATPAMQTEVKLIYNQDYLYVAAILHDDEMDDLSRNVIVPGQGIWQDDMFGVSIDTYNTRKDSYYFATNINEFKEEGLDVGNQNYISEWDGIWHVATSEHKDHWIVEMAIPFKTLSFDPDSAQWGINFLREFTRPDQVVFWNSHGGTPRPWSAEHMGKVSGLSNLSQGVGLDVKLSASAKSSKDYVEDANSTEFTPSVDIFFKPTSDINTALTLNTDFSATDADEQQVNLTRFSLFIPEKRDFFLQDAGVFEFAKLSGNGQPFFSRTIGLSEIGEPLDINAGVKVTGKLNNADFGFIGVNQDYADNQSGNLFVFRGSTEVRNGLQAGIIATQGSQNLESDNQLWGADVQYRNTDLLNGDAFEVIAWYQSSESGELSQNTSGKAWGSSIALPNESLNIKLSYLEIDEQFQPGLGFVNRTGIKEVEVWVNLSNPNKPDIANRLYHGIFFNEVFSSEWVRQTASYSLNLAELIDKDGTYYSFSFGNDFDFVHDEFEILPGLIVPSGKYDNISSTLVYANEQTLPIEFVVSWQQGDFYGGTQDDWFLGFADNVNRYVRLGLDFGHNEIQLPSGRFNLKTISTKIDVAFSSKMYWNNWFQFNNVSDQLGVFSRLRWQPNSLTQLDFVLNHVFIDEQQLNSVRQEVSAKLSYTVRY
jgi:hypothetical protein